MAAEGTGGSKLAQLVADHIFGDVYRNMTAAVVYCDGVRYHIREDSRSARPCFEDLLLVIFVHLLDSRQQLRIYERAFFYRPTHMLIAPSY